MKPEIEDRIRAEMDFESGRDAPPPGFPALPEIPGGRYTRRDFFDLEIEHVFRRNWLCIGRVEDVPERGSFKLYRRLGAPIIVVRGKDDVVRAFYNSCRHRGAKVVASECGKASLLRCQYHSWAYGLDGRLITVPDERDFIDLDKSERGLLPIRCETWGGWIFVNLDENAGPLADFLGPLAYEWADIDMASLRVIHRHSATVHCNWKAAMDAFQEIYHISTIHGKSLGQAVNHKAAAFGLMPGGHSRLYAPYNEKARAALGLAGADTPDIAAYPPLARNSTVAYSAFPNLSASFRSTSYQFMMFWPIDVDKVEMEVIGIGPDWGEGDPPAYWAQANAKFREILDEDLDNLSSIQVSLDSKAFTGILANYQERRIYWLHEAVDRMIGVENIPKGLRVAQVLMPFMERAPD